MDNTQPRWTTDQVKEHLPDVQVSRGTIERLGRLSGRGNRFATVSVANDHGWPIAFDVAWETVTHCLNNDRPIRA